MAHYDSCLSNYSHLRLVSGNKSNPMCLFKLLSGPPAPGINSILSWNNFFYCQNQCNLWVHPHLSRLEHYFLLTLIPPHNRLLLPTTFLYFLYHLFAPLKKICFPLDSFPSRPIPVLLLTHPLLRPFWFVSFTIVPDNLKAAASHPLCLKKLSLISMIKPDTNQ